MMAQATCTLRTRIQQSTDRTRAYRIIHRGATLVCYLSDFIRQINRMDFINFRSISS